MSANQMQMGSGLPSMDVISVFTTSFMPENSLKGFPIHTPTSVSQTVTLAGLERNCQGDDVCDWMFHIKEDDGCDTPCKICVTKTDNDGSGFPSKSAKYANSHNDTECGKFSVSTHHNRLGVTVLGIKREEDRNNQKFVTQAWIPYSDAELCADRPVADRNQPLTCDKEGYITDPSQYDELMKHMDSKDEDEDDEQSQPQQKSQ